MLLAVPGPWLDQGRGGCPGPCRVGGGCPGGGRGGGTGPARRYPIVICRLQGKLSATAIISVPVDSLSVHDFDCSILYSEYT